MKLKPELCKKCGSKAMIGEGWEEDLGDCFAVGCSNDDCMEDTKLYKTKTEAIRVWNRTGERRFDS